MPYEPLELPPEPASAAELVRNLSKKQPVLVFKRSPICPVSFLAEHELRAWLSRVGDEGLLVAEIDVIAQKPLARGLADAVGVRHESPQALLFSGGELVWHDSHEGLNEKAFAARLAAL